MNRNIVQLTLLQHHLRCHSVPDRVHQQVYLNPYPKELMLRNRVFQQVLRASLRYDSNLSVSVRNREVARSASKGSVRNESCIAERSVEASPIH